MAMDNKQSQRTLRDTHILASKGEALAMHDAWKSRKHAALSLHILFVEFRPHVTFL